MQSRVAFLFALFAACLAFGAPAHADYAGTNFSFPAITKVEEKLNLTPVQKAQFDIALTATKVAFLAIEKSHKDLKAFADRELLNARPDLDSLNAELDDALELNRLELQKAKIEWLKLYPTLSDEQVAVVRAALQERVVQASWIREFIVKWFVVKRG